MRRCTKCGGGIVGSGPNTERFMSSCYCFSPSIPEPEVKTLKRNKDREAAIQLMIKALKHYNTPGIHERWKAEEALEAWRKANE